MLLRRCFSSCCDLVLLLMPAPDPGCEEENAFCEGKLAIGAGSPNNESDDTAGSSGEQRAISSSQLGRKDKGAGT